MEKLNFCLYCNLEITTQIVLACLSGHTDVLIVHFQHSPLIFCTHWLLSGHARGRMWQTSVTSWRSWRKARVRCLMSSPIQDLSSNSPGGQTRNVKASKTSMFKTSKRRSSYLTGGSDGMLCCKVMWMLKSNVLAQCAHLLPASLQKVQAASKQNS